MVCVLSDGYVKTRKSHKCVGCLEIIPTGTKVYHQTCVDDGIYDVYMCDSCRDWCSNMENKNYATGETIKGCEDCFESESAFEGYIRECKIDRGRSVNGLLAMSSL